MSDTPTVAELEARIQRLTTQVAEDAKLAQSANDAFAKAVKSGDVERALELADKRTATKATVAKTEAQLKTAKSALQSAQWAANAERIAAIHNSLRDGKLNVSDAFSQLETFGVTRVTVERSEETGKLIVNSVGPHAPKRSGGGGGGGKSTPLTVDGQTFPSASAALMHFRPDFGGKMGVAGIRSWLANNGHEVA